MKQKGGGFMASARSGPGHQNVCGGVASPAGYLQGGSPRGRSGIPVYAHPLSRVTRSAPELVRTDPNVHPTVVLRMWELVGPLWTASQLPKHQSWKQTNSTAYARIIPARYKDVYSRACVFNLRTQKQTTYKQTRASEVEGTLRDILRPHLTRHAQVQSLPKHKPH